METLSDFLGVPEEVEFKFNNTTQVEFINSKFKIFDNKLMIKRPQDKSWCEAYININELIELEIGLLPQSILTNEEREYLKVVIKPVKNEVKYVMKECASILGAPQYIYINLGNKNSMALYNFEPNTQFKGMELDKPYTLKELGLE